MVANLTNPQLTIIPGLTGAFSFISHHNPVSIVNNCLVKLAWGQTTLTKPSLSSTLSGGITVGEPIKTPQIPLQTLAVVAMELLLCYVNTLGPRQDGRQFPDDVFKCIFFNENILILIKISLKFIPKDPIANNRALVLIMPWPLTGDKPLSEPVMASLLTHIGVTGTQWVKPSKWSTEIVKSHSAFFSNTLSHDQTLHIWQYTSLKMRFEVNYNFIQDNLLISTYW